MGESQLKKLKKSLREQGILGPQQSKKQKRKNAQDERARSEKRLRRTAALASIREQFNPFDLKHNARGPKFAVTTNRPVSLNADNGINGRPALSKSFSEQKRRETLLVEMQRRSKVGGILDRRFGENDPTIAPEDKMLERFAREKQKSHKKNAVFDLEDDELGEGLTHLGKSLIFDEPQLVDDFNEDDIEESDHSESSGDERKQLKRTRALMTVNGIDEEENDSGQPERKKSKQEIMKEVIAKSKLHKYERQAAKEQDDDLRTELDKELPDLQALLFASGKASGSRTQESALEADASPLRISGMDKDSFEKEFDQQVKKLAKEKRAQPTERTKTEEEKAEEASARLKELEEQRLKRMRGEKVSDEEDGEEEGGNSAIEDNAVEAPFFQEEAIEDFGLGRGIKARPTATQLGFDDEDDFFVEDDLIASGSDLEPLDSDVSEDEGADADDDDDEFTKGLTTEVEAKIFTMAAQTQPSSNTADDGLPFTFPCPQSVTELLELSGQHPQEKLPTIVQRIRALYHPKLDSKNKEKLVNFSKSLVDYISIASEESRCSPPVSESLIRHIHSLTKSFPVDIAKQFRHHLEEIAQLRPLSPHSGDLILLTAIGSIFPTSDHFHQVVTPATLTITRFLGQKVPEMLADFATGTYLSILAVQYQHFSKRYIPEVMNFCLNTLCALAPVPAREPLGGFPRHELAPTVRIQNAAESRLSKLNLSDCRQLSLDSHDALRIKVSILDTTVKIILVAADIWVDKPSFNETFEPAVQVLKHLNISSCRTNLPESVSRTIGKTTAKLEQMLKLAHLSRRPLQLHHHRPLAIKTFIPKFEDAFDPHKHYDPDRDRAELSKLKAEHKKERKEAMRELRKDANFMARENLRIKKARDVAYEKKYKRLVAEIQGEEGREANAYEREKQSRRRQRNR